jgi:cytochrome c-type biogenesis protein CcmH/NrfG
MVPRTGRSRRRSRADRAAGKALQLPANAPLIEMLLGQALITADNKGDTEEVVAILRAVLRVPDPLRYRHTPGWIK